MKAPLQEIEAMHQFSREALQKKDLQAYMSVFSQDLRYHQFNGKIIDKKQLVKDQKRYFSKLKSFSTNYEQLSYEVHGNEFTETLQHSSTVVIKAFYLLEKTWQVERKAKYTWLKIAGNWRIIKVLVLEEKVQ
jgi:ketosteroid isomerase-like protein